jgi:hypothetical protein
MSTTKKSTKAVKTAKPSSKVSAKKATTARKADTGFTDPDARPVTPAPAPAPAANKVKRHRTSHPLYAEVKLHVLRELLGDDDDATVTVSRNFVLTKKREQADAVAAKELGI